MPTTTVAAIKTNLQETHTTQPTFLQTALEILESIEPYLQNMHATEVEYALVERLLVPERIVSFKVVWSNDAGNVEHNIGYRVQFNSALGPYKGGLRFDPSVNEDILKFLGFEQIFKNALTGLPLGGGKGGSNFDPKGKSETEIRAFCRAFMLELYRHIGPDTDVPAGDIGVSGTEIGYMYGMYRQITNRHEGVLTGKGVGYGGSEGRTSATGHGVVYFAQAITEANSLSLSGMKVVVSGAGNVAQFTARKLIELGATVQTLSDRHGHLYKETGLTNEDIDAIAACKNNKNNLDTLTIEGATFMSGTPWQQHAVDAYFPCATQNEVDESDAKAMIQSAKLIVEGANMPLTASAADVVRASDVLYAPGKAANAGGVAVSGLEMVQNASHMYWEAEKVEKELKKIMQNIHTQCVEYGTNEKGTIDYVNGANIAGFAKVFSAMQGLGW